MATKKSFRTSLRIGTVDYGYWDSNAGGEVDADETKYTPYDEVQRTSVGTPQIGNVTLSRDYRPARDGVIAQRQVSLIDQVATVVILDKDENGNWQQNRPALTGLVKTVTLPEGDSNSNDQAMVSIVVSIGEPV